MPIPLLYEHPLSPFAQKNKIALREKGVAFDLVTPDGMGAGGVGELGHRPTPGSRYRR